MGALEIEEEEKILGVVDIDLYAPGLNFVFGEADMNSGVAIISLCRLRPEHYGLPPDESLFLERVIKEAIHELGHTYGLGHCHNSRCVVYFSNSLPDTDRK
jgi:archaemetzincin